VGECKLRGKNSNNSLSKFKIQIPLDGCGTTTPTATGGTLTTGGDILTPAGNSSISASLVYAAAAVTVDTTSNLSAADQIIGTGTGNVLNVTVTGGNAGTTFAPALISGVQTFNVRNVSGQTNSLDASTMTGLTAYNADRSTSVDTVTNLASGASAGVTGNGTLVNAAFNAGWVGTATAATLNIMNGTTGTGVVTVTGAAVLATTINSTGAANTIGNIVLPATGTSATINATTALTTGSLTSVTPTLATLTITGAGAVNLSGTALETTVTTINASANSGGVTFTMPTTVTTTATGSSGNDVITTNAILITGSVNAGAGTGDVLVVGAVNQVNTAPLAAKYTNFEVLRVNGTIDASLIAGINAIQLTAATNSITNMSATQAAAVTAYGTALGATTLTLANSAGTADVLSINMGTGLTTAAAASAGVLTISGFETLNLTTAAGPTATAGANKTSVITGAIVDTSLTNINLNGNSFTFTDVSGSNAETINGSALTGDGAATPVGLTISGGATLQAGSVITGSATAGNAFTVAAVGSSWTGGAAADTFTMTAAMINATGTGDTVINGGAGIDTLSISDVAPTLSDTYFSKVSNMEKLTFTGTGAESLTVGSAFNAAFPTGVTITSGVEAAGPETLTYNLGLTTIADTVVVTTGALLGTATTANQTITTGSGADNVSFTDTSWVGATGGAAGIIAISTGAGNDTISVSVGTQLVITTHTGIQITPGTGADTVNLTHVNAGSGLTATINIAPGDSPVGGNDTINGFNAGTGSLFSDTLHFTNETLTTYVAAAPTGYTAAQLTVAVSATGVATFAGTSAAALTLAQQIAAVQAVVITNQGDSCEWVNNGTTYVFNNDTGGDSVVALVGVAGVALATTNATTLGTIFMGVGTV
jgi:hypothetical protein